MQAAYQKAEKTSGAKTKMDKVEVKNMRYILIAIAAFCIGFEYSEAQHPAEYYPVTVTVAEGDTLGSLAWRMKNEYGDQRDWRVIADWAQENNKLGRYVYPGQNIVFQVEKR